ncbi:hypothetical protein [Rhodohalobacter sp.]|uniref:hypothetical protein n=1 Tax=Rhodohalobacter sp. TaxID=1974210 RepID=UPI002ACE18C4|nr:hypothetical protein [Rhodohalobacter sp.]MDZ7755980.1 hypothetical protein [Rhodohalobacter sp.]
MAKKIRWTTCSITDRTSIYKYWLERNQSDIYPEKLEQLFENSAELISNFLQETYRYQALLLLNNRGAYSF